MATLDDLWARRSDITQVAVRVGKPVYVSMGHDTAAEAAERAIQTQGITADDLMADDWELRDAPP